MLKVAICDDAQSYIRYLENLIRQTGIKNMKLFEYTSGKQILHDLDQMHDIIILDIQLGDLDGNRVAEKIREANKFAVLALCSGVAYPTEKAFAVDAYRYLIKSNPDTKTIKVLKEIFDEAERRFTSKYLMAKAKDAQIRIKISNILYISKLKYGIEIHMATEEPYYAGKQLTMKCLLGDMYERLKDEGFEYAHSSYIVNCRWVGELEKDCLRFINGDSLPISRNMRKRFTDKMAGTLAGKYSDF